MSETDGLKFACDLDGQGGAQEIGWPEIHAPVPDGTTRWIHLNRYGEVTEPWLREQSGLSELACDALLAENTRPRVTKLHDGFLVILRGVNLNPEADPEDMVGVRILIEPHRIISLRLRKLKTTEDIRNELKRGNGPTNVGAFIARMAERLTERMEPVIEDLDDRLGAIEEDVFSGETDKMPGDLSVIRYAVITLLRYIAPQKDALLQLSRMDGGLLDDHQKRDLGETADISLRYAEDLAAMRERASIVYDEIRTRQGEHTNRTLYLLTIVSAVLLPPSLIAGLFGINVGGMPGLDHPHAFSFVVLGVGALCVVEFLLLRKLKWI